MIKNHSRISSYCLSLRYEIADWIGFDSVLYIRLIVLFPYFLSSTPNEALNTPLGRLL